MPDMACFAMLDPLNMTLATEYECQQALRLLIHYNPTLTTSKALIASLLLMCCGMLQVLRNREAQRVAGPQAGKGPPRGLCSAPGRAACGAAARRRQSVRARWCVQSML